MGSNVNTAIANSYEREFDIFGDNFVYRALALRQDAVGVLSSS